MKIIKSLNSLIFSLLFALTICTTSAVGQEMQLTKKQMYQDFDQLVQIIEDGNPQLFVRKAVTGYDNLNEIKKLRKNIDTITSTETFYSLLNSSLSLLMDRHTTFDYNYYPSFEMLDNIDTLSLIKLRDKYTSYEYNRERERYSYNKYFGLKVTYHDNNYYIKGNNYLINKKDTLHIFFMKVISYNSIAADEFIKENCNKTDYSYDYINNKFYYGSQWYNFPAKGIIKGEQKGEIIEFRIEDYPELLMSDKIEVQEEEIPLIDFFNKENRVEYFEKDSILFICLNRMMAEEDFFNKIKEVGYGKEINKVVIDVRDNLGGSDIVWMNTLSAIIKDTLVYNAKLAYKDTKMAKDKLRLIKDSKPQKIDWLYGDRFRIVDVNFDILPDTNSLNYDKKIYVLSNRETFSAGHSLVNFANTVDNIISIGTPTGRIVGFGMMPQLFQLKHSKFSFRMPVTIDITNAKEPIDVYQDKKEIEVQPSIEEELIYPVSKYDTKSKEYLYKYDSMFKKVLELK